jgi:hypothetical protein
VSYNYKHYINGQSIDNGDKLLRTLAEYTILLDVTSSCNYCFQRFRSLLKENGKISDLRDQRSENEMGYLNVKKEQSPR